MIPGNHYNWVNDEFTTTTPLDGLRCLYRQMLIGDRADNIFGVDGIGKVKAARIIDVLDDEQDMIETVFSLYKEDVERFIMNAQCLWILQREGETWAHRVNYDILPLLLKQRVMDIRTTYEDSFGEQKNDAEIQITSHINIMVEKESDFYSIPMTILPESLEPALV
jgi:5'-3' exonuclease